MIVASMKPGYTVNGNTYTEEVIAKMMEQINTRFVPIVNEDFEGPEINVRNVIGQVKHASRDQDGTLLLDVDIPDFPFNPRIQRLSSRALGYVVDHKGIEPECNVANESAQSGIRTVSHDGFQIIGFSIQPK